MKVGILCSRIRVEEKLILAEMDRRGVDYVKIDDDEITAGVPELARERAPEAAEADDEDASLRQSHLVFGRSVCFVKSHGSETRAQPIITRSSGGSTVRGSKTSCGWP